MTSPWTGRPAHWGDPGHVNRGDEYEEILDQIEYVSTGTPALTRYKATDTSRNNVTGTTYATDPDLAVTVDAFGVYAYHFHMGISANAAPQMKTRLILPSGTLGAAAYHLATAFSPPASPTTISEVVGITAAAGTPYAYYGTLFVGATGGTFGLQWAQNVSNAIAIVMQAGSWLKLQRLA